MKKIECGINVALLAICVVSFSSEAQEQINPDNESLAALGLCPSGLSSDVCHKYLEKLRATVDADHVRDTASLKSALATSFRDSLSDPEFLNAVLTSPSIKNGLSNIPLEMTFKMLDREEEDAVLGLEFSYARTFNNTVYDDKGETENAFQFNVDIRGVVTQEAEENPRNFIEAGFAFSGSTMPSFDLQKIESTFDISDCETSDNIDDIECAKLLAKEQEAFFSQIGSAFYLNYGVDIGYETDQEFDASNQTLGGFFYASYEDFRRNTFFGYTNLRPSIRIAAETVDPNAETPRSLAGDDSSYTRISGEVSVVLPLPRLLKIPYDLTFNYRTWNELEASDTVKQANLDSYQLRTYSLRMPTGLIFSYSSGRLPFGLENEQTVELGFKTYF